MISLITALAIELFPPVNPSSILAAYNSQATVDRLAIKLASTVPNKLKINKGLRPKRSESLPKIGVPIN